MVISFKDFKSTFWHSFFFPLISIISVYTSTFGYKVAIRQIISLLFFIIWFFHRNLLCKDVFKYCHFVFLVLCSFIHLFCVNNLFHNLWLYVHVKKKKLEYIFLISDLNNLGCNFPILRWSKDITESSPVCFLCSPPPFNWFAIVLKDT